MRLSVWVSMWVLTVEAEDDEQDAADDEWCDDVCV